MQQQVAAGLGCHQHINLKDFFRLPRCLECNSFLSSIFTDFTFLNLVGLHMPLAAKMLRSF